MKEQVPINCIYLLGAGRSGTTLLATVMDSNDNVLTLGEMNQFYAYLAEDRSCSCGKLTDSCEFWSKVVQLLDIDKELAMKLKKISDKQEHHSKIIKWLMTKSSNKEYFEFQNKVFQSIQTSNPGMWFLDSSKYIGRYLLLRQNQHVRTKGIYMIRDVRGVINSFSKNVQTTRSPLSAILYYTIINLFGQLVCWLDSKVMKIKYEEFMVDPEKSLARIYSHVFEDEIKPVTLPTSYKMPHIIGGNRIKANKSIKISEDVQWKKNMTKTQQFWYYILCLPLMVLNRYKI